MGKILLISNQLGYGGVEKVLVSVANVLAKTDDVTVFVWKLAGVYEKDLDLRVKVVSLPSKHFLIWYRVMQVFPKLIRKKLGLENFDVELLCRHDICKAYVRFMRGKKNFTFMHADLFYKIDEKSKNDFDKALFKKQDKFLQKLDTVICGSANSADGMIKYFGHDNFNIEILPNCMDLAQIHEMAKVNNKYQNVKKIVSVGRLDKKKNMIDVVKAFELSGLAEKNYCLIIVGDGEERQNIEQYILEKNVKMTILIGADKNPYQFLNNAKCFISASVEEAFGLVYIEAISLGLPIVTYNNRGAMCSLGEVGVFTEMNPISLAEALNALMSDEERMKTLIQKGKELSLNFDIKNYEEKLLNILK